MNLPRIALAPGWPVLTRKLTRCGSQSMGRLGVVNTSWMEAACDLEGHRSLLDALGIFLPVVLQLVITHPLIFMLPHGRIWTTAWAGVKLLTPTGTPKMKIEAIQHSTGARAGGAGGSRVLPP